MRKKNDAFCLLCMFTWTQARTWTYKAKPMRYGFAMATALTTTGISGDFPSVYINHHGNSISLCVRRCTDSGKPTVVCESGGLWFCVHGQLSMMLVFVLMWAWCVCSFKSENLGLHICKGRTGCESMQKTTDELTWYFQDYNHKHYVTYKRREKGKNVTNGNNIPGNIMTCRDNNKLASMMQQNRVSTKSFSFLSDFCYKCQDVRACTTKGNLLIWL